MKVKMLIRKFGHNIGDEVDIDKKYIPKYVGAGYCEIILKKVKEKTNNKTEE